MFIFLHFLLYFNLKMHPTHANSVVMRFVFMELRNVEKHFSAQFLEDCVGNLGIVC